MFKIRVKFCLIYLTFLLAQVIAGNNDGNCNIDEITDSDWENGYIYHQIINDTNVKFDVPFHSNTYIELVTMTNDYLTGTVDTLTSTVHIMTNANNFVNLDQRSSTTEKDLVVISEFFVFRCPDGESTLTFLLVVEDTNNHSPEFNEQYYGFTMPRKKYEVGEDISQYGPEIIVTDLDFANQDVVFTVTPEGAPVTVSTEHLGNKKYRAVVKVADTNFIGPKVLTLVAYDLPFKIEEFRYTSESQFSFGYLGRGVGLKLDSALFLVLTLTWLYNFK